MKARLKAALQTVGEISADARTTVVFMTANSKRIPEDFAGAFGVIAKPYSERVVASALTYVAEAWNVPVIAPRLDTLAGWIYQVFPLLHLVRDLGGLYPPFAVVSCAVGLAFGIAFSVIEALIDPAPASIERLESKLRSGRSEKQELLDDDGYVVRRVRPWR